MDFVSQKHQLENGNNKNCCCQRNKHSCNQVHSILRADGAAGHFKGM